MREVAPIQELQALPPKVVLNRAWWGEPLRRILAALLKRRLPQRLLIRRVEVFNFGVTEVQLKV
jgi:hypothetical protein